eukprot:3714095-Amphidinium_carterae.1
MRDEGALDNVVRYREEMRALCTRGRPDEFAVEMAGSVIQQGFPRERMPQYWLRSASSNPMWIISQHRRSLPKR